jgi:hypothetical protein
MHRQAALCLHSGETHDITKATPNSTLRKALYCARFSSRTSPCTSSCPFLPACSNTSRLRPLSLSPA